MKKMFFVTFCHFQPISNFGQIRYARRFERTEAKSLAQRHKEKKQEAKQEKPKA
jgi:hypothetical protein